MKFSILILRDLSCLFKKKENFTEADKKLLISKQREILRKFQHDREMAKFRTVSHKGELP